MSRTSSHDKPSATGKRGKYRKKSSQFVIAVKLDLDVDELEYRKWGGKQRAKRGDWLVDNDGDVYTVDAKVFRRTYRCVGPGVYAKVAAVWAEVATQAGSIATHEGRTSYKAGDYIVYNDKEGTDVYCVGAAKFKAMYRRCQK